MIDPKLELLEQAAKLTAAIVTMNLVDALVQGKKLVAMIEAYVIPPIDAPSLDPADRAEVDAEVDAAITKK